MKYKPKWDLSTIPDTEFYSEAARRRRSKRPKKQVDGETREYLDKKAAAMRRLRDQRKRDK